MTTRFPISFTPWMRLLMTPMGAGPRRSWVDVDDEHVAVRLGYTFRARLDRRAVVSAAPLPGRVMAWGAHGWRHRWLVNGSSSGIVLLDVEPMQRGWVLGVPIRLRQLAVSLEDPDALLATLATLAAPVAT